MTDESLKTLAFYSILVVLVVVIVFRSARWLARLVVGLGDARGGTARRREREQAIAALCAQRGMVPNPVDLSAVLSNVFSQLVGTNKIFKVLAAGAGPPLTGQIPIYENSFASPDGSLWAADMWTPGDKQQWKASSMLVFAVPGVNLPYIGVTRKGQPSTSQDQALITLGGRGRPVELESIDFNERFTIRADDRRSAVMLLDQGMMEWLLECDQVSFEITAGHGTALVSRSSEPTYQPGLSPAWHWRGQSNAPYTNPHRADPVELELLFKFVDGFGPRVPNIVRSEFAAVPTA